MSTNITATPYVFRRICHKESTDGVFFPMEIDKSWGEDPSGIHAGRAIYYFVLLMYMFIGIAVGSDVFMGSIEQITSMTRAVKGVAGKVTHVNVWSDTVAALTLMALGSSAPEILLATVEIVQRQYIAGELGAGTIIGSAAFNQFLIVAVCICAIPEGEVRAIESLPVFYISAAFAGFAYAWFVLVLVAFTPGVITVTEAIITMGFLPILIYGGWRAEKMGEDDSQADETSLAARLTKQAEKLAGDAGTGKPDLFTTIAKYHAANPHVSESHLTRLMEQMTLRNEEGLTKAKKRHLLKGGKDKKFGGGIKSFNSIFENVISHVGFGQNASMAKAKKEKDMLSGPTQRIPTGGGVKRHTHTVRFEATEFSVVENMGFVRIPVVREGTLQDELEVTYSTRDGTAMSSKTCAEMHQQKVLELEKAQAATANLPGAIADDANNVSSAVPAVTNNGNSGDPLDNAAGILPGAAANPDSDLLPEGRPSVGAMEGTKQETALVATTNNAIKVPHQMPDYVYTEGTLTLPSGSRREFIEVEIVDDDAAEEDEHFFVDLHNAVNKDDPDNSLVKISKSEATITIIDDDGPGKITFADFGDVKVKTLFETTYVQVPLQRRSGAVGTIACDFVTKNGAAKGGKDYVACRGEVAFGHGECATSITLQIKPSFDTSASSDTDFFLVLCNPRGFKNFNLYNSGDQEFEQQLRIVLSKDAVVSRYAEHVRNKVEGIKDSLEGTRIGYMENIKACFNINGSEEEAEEASGFDKFMFILSFPWKLLFAITCPPPDVLGGYPCFLLSLAGVGCIVAVVNDLGQLFGCTIDITDTLTAVTIVAAGTSLPDTFASKIAAERDETADDSITNISGSNSVNVFLGLGLPWLMAALYWESTTLANGGKPTDFWVSRNGCINPVAGSGVDVACKTYPGQFLVKPGGVLPATICFLICQILAIACLMWRRKHFGGELGGPAKERKWHSVLMIFFWVLVVVVVIVGSDFAF